MASYFVRFAVRQRSGRGIALAGSVPRAGIFTAPKLSGEVTHEAMIGRVLF